MRLTDFLHDIGRPMVFYPRLNDIVGGMAANVFLNQLLYWHGKGENHEGWIYKSRLEIQHETGLGRDSQESARRELRLRGFLQEKFSYMPRRLLFRLNLDAINAAWEEAIYQHKVEIPPTDESACVQHKVDIPPSIRVEIHQHAGGKAPSMLVENPPAYTEMTTEMTTEKKETPPAPSSTSIDEVTNRDSPAGKFVSWWNEQIVPLGGRPFSLEDADDKFIAKANKALKAKGSKSFWDRVEHGFEASGFLRGKVKPPPGKRQFKATLPWLLSMHHTKGMANYALVAENEWADDTAEEHERKAISHDEVEL